MQVSLLNNGLKNHRQSSQNGQQNNAPSFKGAEGILMAAAPMLQRLEADPIQGVIFLDVTTAIAPNTAIDTVERNPAQGFETFRREFSGLAINCILPGIAVVGVAKLLKDSILGDEFKHLPAHRIWANEDTLDECAATWKKVSSKSTKQERVTAFINECFRDRIVANSESLKVKGTSEQKRAAESSINTALDSLTKAILEENNADYKKGISNKKLNEVYEHLAKAYGSSKGVQINRLVPTKDSKTFSTDMKNYIRDTFALARAYEDKSVSTHGVEKLTERMKKLLKVKSGGTMAAVGLLALAMHAINRKITEKMTGRKGYSGYKDLDPSIKAHEDKGGLFGQKLLASAWFGGLAFLSMGVPSLGMLNFAAPTTTMNQARTLSLVTDIGRVNAACDKNEIKDTLMRDTLIFMNLYVLGDFVQRGIVNLAQKHYKKKGIDVNLMNEAPKPADDAGFIKKFNHFIKGKSVKSFEEIEGTIAHGASVQQRKNIVTAATLASLSYSLGALGIIAPIMIAKITNKNREKQIAEAKKRAAATTVAATAATVGATVVNASEHNAPKTKIATSIKQSNVRTPKLHADSQG